MPIFNLCQTPWALPLALATCRASYCIGFTQPRPNQSKKISPRRRKPEAKICKNCETCRSKLVSKASKTSFRDVGDRRSTITLLKAYGPSQRALIQTRRGDIDYGEQLRPGFAETRPRRKISRVVGIDIGQKLRPAGFAVWADFSFRFSSTGRDFLGLIWTKLGESYTVRYPAGGQNRGKSPRSPAKVENGHSGKVLQLERVSRLL